MRSVDLRALRTVRWLAAKRGTNQHSDCDTDQARTIFPASTPNTAQHHSRRDTHSQHIGFVHHDQLNNNGNVFRFFVFFFFFLLGRICSIGTRLLAGREFDANDTKTSPSVAIVDEAFVRRFFPGVSAPIGRALSFDDSKPEGGERTSIIGVVPDIRHEGLREPAKPTVYSPVAQPQAMGGRSVLVYAEAPPAAVAQMLRREMAKLSGEVVLTEPETILRHIDDSIFQERILATLSGFFGLLALLLAAIGLYGVVSYGTARRAREIGVRIALGARRSGVLWMVLRDALMLVSAGLVVGLPLAIVSVMLPAPAMFF